MSKIDIEPQEATRIVAELIDSAKKTLKIAKEIADEAGVLCDLQNLYEEVTGEYVDWYNSNC